MSADSRLLSRAIEIAAHAHRDQVDKSDEPYILHPLRVMLLARDAGLPLSIQCAAVLHDVLEDTDVSMDELVEFNVDIAVAVRVVTKMEGEKYDAFIDRISRSTDDIIRLKLCDIADNTAGWRLKTPELAKMSSNKYTPAREKLERELAARRCAAGEHCWASGGGKMECNDCGVLG